MKKQELQYWVAWNYLSEIGPKRFYTLLEEHGSAENAWAESSAAVTRLLKLNYRISQRFSEKKKRIIPEKALDILNNHQVQVVTIKDTQYPVNLKEIHLPPPLLYYRGTLLDSDKNAISIVGSRKASYYGKMVADEMSKNLALTGLTVISGLARGIDAIAHQSALSVGGRTIAVLGCGIDTIYPPENRKLAQAIEKSGAIVSEFPLRTPPERQNFPRRNRIISGLSFGILVIEAAERSGALITADYALEQGREIFAIPGNINSPLSKGAHSLIKQGAKLVHEYKDVLEEIPFEAILQDGDNIRPISVNDLSDNELLVYKLLFKHKPVQIDEIAERSHLAISKVSEILLNLELKDLAKEMTGKNYIKA